MSETVQISSARLIVGVLAVLLLVPAMPAGSQSGSARAGGAESAVTAVGSQTAEELSACLQQRPNLAVAVLIDETGSLRTTDPNNERAPVLAGFLERLEDLAGTDFGDRTRQVLVTVAYFGTGVDPLLSWQPIGTPQPVPGGPADARRSIAESIRAETPGRNRDLTTEFSAALEWAADRHREVPGLIEASSVCTLTVWFSDGELDPDNQPRAPYERDAVFAETARLCDAGGALDDHRSTGAALVGILLVELLTDTSSVTRLPRMHAMVEGIDPVRRTCGTSPSRGLYLEGGLDLLSLQFERAVTPGQGGVLQGTYRGDPVSFMVDRGVAKVRIVMSARDGFRLFTASGARVDVAQPSAAPSTSGLPRGVSPDIRWASGAVSIDLAVAGAFGEWRVERKGRSTEVDVYYFTDLRLELLTDEVRLTSGETGAVHGRVVDGSGGATDLDDYATRTLAVQVDGVQADVELLPDGTFRATFPVDTDEARILARLRLDLITTGGTVLQPVTREVLLPVTLPGWFPQVTIAREFDTSLIPGSADARLNVVAVGSDLGSTRVCVRPGPPGDGTPELRRLVSLRWAETDLSQCIELAPGARVEADLLATLQGSEVREVRVGVPLTVVLESAAVDGRAAVTVDYPERRSVVVQPAPPNPLIVLALLLLGLLIPLGILHLLNRCAARFRTRNLQIARVPVELVRTHGTWRVQRAGAGATSLLSIDDLGYLPAQGVDGAREWQAGAYTEVKGGVAGETWRAVVPGWPLGTVRAVVEAPAGHRIVSNEVPTVVDDGMSAGIGLNPQRCAYLLVADADLRSIDAVADTRIAATLVTVLGHAGSVMDSVVQGHGQQLETVMIGGDELDRLVDVVRASDAAMPDASAGSAVAPAGPSGGSAWNAPLGSGLRGSAWDASSGSPSDSSGGSAWDPPSGPAGGPPDGKGGSGRRLGWD
jgi:hypothetical protein